MVSIRPLPIHSLVFATSNEHPPRHVVALVARTPDQPLAVVLDDPELVNSCQILVSSLAFAVPAYTLCSHSTPAHTNRVFNGSIRAPGIVKRLPGHSPHSSVPLSHHLSQPQLFLLLLQPGLHPHQGARSVLESIFVFLLTMIHIHHFRSGIPIAAAQLIYFFQSLTSQLFHKC